MKDLNRCLLILPYYLEDAYVDTLKATSSDILALSLPAMQQLDTLNIKYLTIGNFVDQSEFDLHLSRLKESLDEFLINCDVASKKIYDLDRLFSSNGFWFLHRLSHLSFMQILIQELDNCYDEIEIFSKEVKLSDQYILDDFSKLNFPLDDLVGLEGLVVALMKGLEQVTIRKEVINTNDANSNETIQDLIIRSPELIFRKSIELVKEVVRFLYPFKKQFWSTYISYDVERLSSQRYDWKVKPIMDSQILRANKCAPKGFENSEAISNEILSLSNDFFITWIPSFYSIFQNIVHGYLGNILPRISEVRIAISKQIKESQPKAIFFSTGIQNLLQESIADVANENKLPVYSFKHTGIEHLFFKSQYLDSYYDYNLTIKRTQFLANESELKIFEKASKVTPIVSGNLKPRSLKKNYRFKASKKIIYSVGQPDHSSFHFYHSLLNDFERHVWTKNLLQSIKRNRLKLDIKIHPVESSVYKKYFTNLILQEDLSPKECNLISGGSIERILSNYDLLVLDLVPTQVLSAALSLGMNIILFKQPSHIVNEDTYKDLEDRVHIVSDFKELHHKLCLYGEGGLLNNSSSLFENKYLTSNSDLFCIID